MRPPPGTPHTGQRSADSDTTHAAPLALISEYQARPVSTTGSAAFFPLEHTKERTQWTW